MKKSRPVKVERKKWQHIKREFKSIDDSINVSTESTAKTPMYGD